MTQSGQGRAYGLPAPPPGSARGGPARCLGIRCLCAPGSNLTDATGVRYRSTWWVETWAAPDPVRELFSKVMSYLRPQVHIA